ncbi:NB-ARC domain protein [Rubidibacter lacunae KORDI 51-2]|uniref:NB-ARC domain protein n=2 Tax=Rubidibacter TaxID=582491 RepID=U5DMB5_9CHRO|nr:NB-ARC domain protein [Rubidibacter lacunae KORDI 51-2]
MNVDDAIALFIELWHQRDPQGSLSPIQEQIFRRSWDGSSYEEIARDLGYSPHYLRQVGSQLWQVLGWLTERSVNKTTFRLALAEIGSAAAHSDSPPIFISRAELPAQLYGRTSTLALLRNWLDRDCCRLISIRGVGGVGKTALAAKLVERVGGSFDRVIWHSLFAGGNCTGLVEAIARRYPKDIPPPTGSNDRVAWLMAQLRSRRYLIVLDRYDALFRTGERAGRYESESKPYERLLERAVVEAHQSCLVLTSREQLANMPSVGNCARPARELKLSGLLPAAACKLLCDRGLQASPAELHALTHHYAGNPRALLVAATLARQKFYGIVAPLLASDKTFPAELEDLLGTQFARLSAGEKTLACWLARCDRPTARSAMRSQLRSQFPGRNLTATLDSLQARSLLSEGGGTCELEPLLRRYLRASHPDVVSNRQAS